ncbi:uncharacterized protein LOC110437634 [Sorghum bicolor]|uniref:uncharacterized protein LOC110437634 n=1 Tax=Sorghum bicolor TaxID=4558 RepID=UPI000B425CEA|nr:uncharacterized protein LOC110437634 [Sorghum bicolor]|eukprot:XP_021321806.1 uncharacterized protein LOC110437634 [Sorghum bicolor]
MFGLVLDGIAQQTICLTTNSSTPPARRRQQRHPASAPRLHTRTRRSPSFRLGPCRGVVISFVEEWCTRRRRRFGDGDSGVASTEGKTRRADERSDPASGKREAGQRRSGGCLARRRGLRRPPGVAYRRTGAEQEMKSGGEAANPRSKPAGKQRYVKVWN